MQSKPKSNSVVTTQLLPDGRIQWTVLRAAPDGTNETLTLDPRKVHPANVKRAAVHGFVQKVTDRAAIPYNQKTGKYATPREKFLAMQGLVQHFESGSESWRMADTGARGPVLDALLLAAVSEATGRSEEEVREMVIKGAERKSIAPAAYLAAAATSDAAAPIVQRMRDEAARAIQDDPNAIMREMMGDAEADDDAEADASDESDPDSTPEDDASEE